MYCAPIGWAVFDAVVVVEIYRLGLLDAIIAMVTGYFYFLMELHCNYKYQ